MKGHFNIETQRNSDGSRTGYDSTGRSWRIYGRHGNWTARANVTNQGLLGLLLGYETLQEISEILSTIGKPI